MKTRLTKREAQRVLRVHDGSLIGDIVVLDQDTARRLLRAGYIVDNGAYCLTQKALLR